MYLNRNYSVLLKSNHEIFKPGKSTGKLQKIKLDMIPDIKDKTGTENICILPVPAWNRYNEWMAGLLMT